jgi:hypothetical protein
LRRNFLLKHVIEGLIEWTGRRGRRRKELLDDLKKRRCYCKLKEAVLDALSGELALEEAMDLTQDRLRNELINSGVNYSDITFNFQLRSTSLLLLVALLMKCIKCALGC